MSAETEKGVSNNEASSEVTPFDDQSAPLGDQPPTDSTRDSAAQINQIEEAEIPPNASTFESTEDPRPAEPVVEPKPDSPQKQASAAPIDSFASKAKDLGELLLNLAIEKKCPDHNQPVVTICTNFTCTRRFWCGICCVKYKDLYVRHNSDMTLIEDFLSENLGKLYKVKTCMEGDKQELETLLDKLQGQLENYYHDLWTKAEVDIDKLKQEIVTRLETNRSYLKERHDKWLGNVHDFFGQVKSRVRDSPVRDCGAELELLRKNVEQSHDEVLGVIETIGNKVTKDISLIEDLNKQFSKTREFIGFLESQFDHVRDQTSPFHGINQ